MKKVHNSLPDSRSDSAELPVRLYRAISDVARHLDDQRARTEYVCDLFAESIETQRMRLRDYCDKLMFTDPITYGKKAEELLWRKVFYEVVATVKRLNKNGKKDVRESCLLQSHLQAGIGFYHYIIMKLQSQFRLDLRGMVDFPLFVTDPGLPKDGSWWSGKSIESGALEWAHCALHRCLIYLGDLCRYLIEFNLSADHSSAQRYYAQALNWKPEYGMPHNQLGTLVSNLNYSLDAAYYYMRCLSCTQRFDGAEGNLQHLIDQNEILLLELRKGTVSEPPVKKLILTFIHISYSLFYEKNPNQINQLCAEVLGHLEACLVEVDSAPAPPVASSEPTSLSDDMLFKMLVMTIMSIQQLQSKNSQQTVGGVALFLALLSQIIQFAINRMGSVLPSYTAPPPIKKPTARHRRRRRRCFEPLDLSDDDNASIGSSNSDTSEENVIFDECDESEDEIQEQDIENMKGSNKSIADSTKPWEHRIVTTNKAFQYIHQLSRFGFIFQTIKVGFDWIESNQMFLKSCGGSSAPLISRLVIFFNHLCSVPNLSNLKELCDDDIVDEEGLCSTPLPEDVAVRALEGLQPAQAKLSWDRIRTEFLKPYEETYVRICCLLRFGKILAETKACHLRYNEKKHWFSDEVVQNGRVNGLIPSVPKEKAKAERSAGSVTTTRAVNGIKGVLTKKESNERQNGKIDNGRSTTKKIVSLKTENVQKPNANAAVKEIVLESGKVTGSPWEGDQARVEKLMQSMGELWLKSEVSLLEDRARKGMKGTLPPYLVPDPEAFLNHPSLIKQLISAKKFIVLIPSIVLSALDESKQNSGKVRDTIRWLEWQLKNGKRNIRLQRANEHQPLPFIKYPKKKEREAWMFMQVVECCNYLCNQSTGEKNPELVTLLTGSKALLANNQTNGNGYSHIGVAKSAGINVEHIETFFSKWKSSSKSHG